MWVKRTFDLRDDHFVMVDKSVEARNGEDGGVIYDDARLANAKEIEIVEVSPGTFPSLFTRSPSHKGYNFVTFDGYLFGRKRQ